MKSIRQHGVRMRLLVTGNVDAAFAHKVASAVVNTLKLPITKKSVLPKAVRFNHPVTLSMPNPTPGDPNSVTIVAYQFGVTSILEGVCLTIINMILEPYAFNVLRTQKQLGYFVQGVLSSHRNIVDMRVTVQGTKKSSEEVLEDIEDLLVSFRRHLVDLEEQAMFETWKVAAVSLIWKKQLNLAKESKRAWSLIWPSKCLQLQDLQVQVIEQISGADVLSAWDTMRSHPKIVVKLGPNETFRTRTSGTPWLEEGVCSI